MLSPQKSELPINTYTQSAAGAVQLRLFTPGFIPETLRKPKVAQRRRAAARSGWSSSRRIVVVRMQTTEETKAI